MGGGSIVFREVGNSPIAGYAHRGGRAAVATGAGVLPGRQRALDAHEWDTDPTTLGTSVALSLLRQGARELIDAIPH